MSHQATNWAIEQTAGSPSGKAVLWSLANYTNHKWCAWPSQELVAKESEQSVDSVRRRLVELEGRQLIRRIPLKIAGRKTVDFIILRPSAYFESKLSEIEPLLPRGCTVDPAHVAADCGNAECFTLPQPLPQKPPDVAATVRQQEPEEPENQVVVVESAREPLITQEAISTAEIIATIAGYPDPKAWPPGWCGAPMRVEAFLREGYHPQHMIAAATEVMAGNPSAKAWSIGYFEKAFARTKARQEAPLPKAEIIGASNGELRNRSADRFARGPRPGSREDTREKTNNAFAKLHQRTRGRPDQDDAGASREIGGPAVGRLPPAKSA